MQWRGVVAWGAGVAVMLGMSHPLRNVLGIVVAALVYWAAVALARTRRAGRDADAH